MGELAYKFSNSGVGGTPTITDAELREYIDGLEDLARFMDDRGDKSMAFVMRIEQEGPERCLYFRNSL